MKIIILSVLFFFLTLWGGCYFGLEVLNINNYYGNSHWYDLPFIVTFITFLILSILFIITSILVYMEEK